MEGKHNLGFSFYYAENGAFVIEVYDCIEDEYKRYVYVNYTDFHNGMRAWMEREIEINFRQLLQMKQLVELNEEVEVGRHLMAAREVS